MGAGTGLPDAARDGGGGVGDRLSLNESGAMTIFTMVRLLARQGERL
ncbi:Uncharacterised protein [Bordetella pertussis]|nr:Uncharacterised protein [Bordetella pertussis]